MSTLASPILSAASAGPYAAPGPYAAAGPYAAPSEDAAPVTVSLTDVAPAVATGDAAATISGAVVNGSDTALPAGEVEVRLDTAPLRTNEQVQQWFAGTTPGNGLQVASTPLPQIAPGGRAEFTLTVPNVVALGRGLFGAFPVAVTVRADGAGTRSQPPGMHTALGYQRKREYQQLSVAVLAALTPDPDPALVGPVSATREKAWAGALQAGSRLDHLLTLLTNPAVGAAIDPTLLGPDLDPVTPTSAEISVRTAYAGALATALAGRSPIVLPLADADVTAGTDPATGAQTLERMRTLVAGARRAASLIDGHAGVLWPADPTWTTQHGTRYAALTGAGSTSSVVVNRASLDWEVTQGDAGRRDTGGTPLLAYDGPLSDAFAAAVRADSAANGRQRVVATSLVRLREAPGLARTVLVVGQRGLDPDPQAGRAALGLLTAVPWLTPGTVSQIEEQAVTAPEASRPLDAGTVDAGSADAGSAGTGSAGTEPAGTGSAGSAPASAEPLTPSALARVQQWRAEASGAAQIRADRDEVLPQWDGRLDQLMSTRWRTDPPAWQQAADTLETEIQASSRAVRVAPQTITFLADRGRLQVTLLNELPVAVHDVRVRLISDSARLVVPRSSTALAIGAGSRATVTFDATAYAAGRVELQAQVLGPDETPVGPTTTLEVTVSPTAAWVYWALGALALLVLAAGIWRPRRQRPLGKA